MYNLFPNFINGFIDTYVIILSRLHNIFNVHTVRDILN